MTGRFRSVFGHGDEERFQVLPFETIEFRDDEGF